MSPLRIALFLVIGGSIVGGIHYYLWARLVRDPVLPAPWSSIAMWSLVALGVATLVAAATSRVVPRDLAQPLMWVVYIWMGLFFYLFMQLAAIDLVRALIAIARKIASASPLDADRRTFIARVIGGGVGVVTLGIGATGLYNVLRDVAVKRVTVPLARLPRAANGYTIVQLTDIHVGPTIGKRFIEQLVATVNSLEPDLVAITGDLVDGSVAELGDLVRPLTGLRAKDGVFFVTGNHEYYSGASAWVAFLTTLGIRVLRNERVAIGQADGGFDLAGVDDITAAGFPDGHGQDIPKALAGRDETRELVLLAHQPRTIVEAEEAGVGLQLSGHTHGGQVFPWNYAVRLQQPYVAGFYQHKRAAIYVSAGTGYWGPPMRVGAPAEITRIELVCVPREVTAS